MNDVPLSDYYNKLIQVQMGVLVARTLHAEIFHHLNNGAAHLLIYQSRANKSYDGSKELIEIARDIAGDVSVESQPIMERVASDEARLKVNTLLVDLAVGKEAPSQASFDGLCALNDRLQSDANSLRFIRAKAEVKMLERSGTVSAPLDLSKVPAGPFNLGEYYNKLAHVQQAAKVATEQRAEVTKRMSATGAAIHAHIRERDVDGLIAEHFMPAEMEIVKETTGQMVGLMAPITIEMQAHNIASTRLVNLIREPETMTPENYEFLCAFNDRVSTVIGKVSTLRCDTELKMLRASGLVPKNFTL